MFKTLWGKFFVLLLVVSAVGLSATFYLRSMMLRDFDSFLDGEQLDQIYIVMAELEGDWELDAGWDLKSLAGNTIQAFMLGMEIRVRDLSGSLLMDTARAMDRLTPLMQRRVLSLTGDTGTRAAGEFAQYPLFLGGEQIGTMEVRFLAHDRSSLFVERSNRFLLLSFLIMGGIAVLASLFASKRLTSPLKALLEQTKSIRRGDLGKRTRVRGEDEIAGLSRAFNEMADDLQLQDSLRRKLIANVAHELRTPIAAMRGELEAVMDGVLPLDRDQVRSLNEEIVRLGTILDGIDDLTQAQASSLTIARRKLDVMAVLGNIRDRFSASAGEKGVQVVLEEGNSLQAWADADKLNQILVNLVSNAVKATQEGGVVTLRAATEKKGTLIEVADTGKGISPEEIPHIFERFYRSEDGGLGLGLSIVKELVDAHDGSIEVESEVGKGTRVKVVLPVEQHVKDRI
jgi:two-component system sensor histidine kinase BaeS